MPESPSRSLSLVGRDWPTARRLLSSAAIAAALVLLPQSPAVANSPERPGGASLNEFSVVSVIGPARQGTGFVIDSVGHVATAAEVVAGSKQVDLVLANSSRIPAQVVAVDPRQNLAILQPSTLQSPLEISAKKVAVGDSVKVRIPAVGDEPRELPAKAEAITGTTIASGPFKLSVDLPIAATGAPVVDSTGAVMAMAVQGVGADGKPVTLAIPVAAAIALADAAKPANPKGDNGLGLGWLEFLLVGLGFVLVVVLAVLLMRRFGRSDELDVKLIDRDAPKERRGRRSPKEQDDDGQPDDADAVDSEDSPNANATGDVSDGELEVTLRGPSETDEVKEGDTDGD